MAQCRVLSCFRNADAKRQCCMLVAQLLLLCTASSLLGCAAANAVSPQHPLQRAVRLNNSGEVAQFTACALAAIKPSDASCAKGARQVISTCLLKVNQSEPPSALQVIGIESPIAYNYRSFLAGVLADRDMPELNWTLVPNVAASISLIREDFLTNHVYPAYLIPAPVFGQGMGVVPNPFLDLAGAVVNDPIMKWSDIYPLYRSVSVSEGRVPALPLQGSLFMMYYRRDLFAAAGVPPPRTWEEVRQAAAYFNGTDLNGDGVLDYGVCWSQPPSCIPSSLPNVWLTAVMSTLLQARGMASGLFFNPSTMQTWTTTPAWQEAIRIYRSLLPYAAPQPLGLFKTCANSPPFAQGRCPMTFGFFSPFKQTRLGPLPGRVGTAFVPGSTQVIDWDTNTLVPCSPRRCPFAIQYDPLPPGAYSGSFSLSGTTSGNSSAAVNGTASGGVGGSAATAAPQQAAGQLLVNHVTYTGFSGLVLAISARQPLEVQYATFAASTYLASQEASWSVTLDLLLEAGPHRKSQLQADALPRYVASGLNAVDAAEYMNKAEKAILYENAAGDTNTAAAIQVRDTLIMALTLIHNDSVPTPAIAAATASHLNAILPRSVLLNITKAQYHSSIGYVEPPPPAPPPPPPAPLSMAPPAVPSRGISRQKLLATVLGPVLGSLVLLAALAAGYWLWASRRRRSSGSGSGAGWGGRVVAPGVGHDTTLCVTDIQSSTLLWELLEAHVMDEALQLHNCTLRQCLLEAGGYESASEGDSFILAFAHPTAALRFCLRAQAALSEQPWSPELLQAEPCRPLWVMQPNYQQQQQQQQPRDSPASAAMVSAAGGGGGAGAGGGGVSGAGLLSMSAPGSAAGGRLRLLGASFSNNGMQPSTPQAASAGPSTLSTHLQPRPSGPRSLSRGQVHLLPLPQPRSRRVSLADTASTIADTHGVLSSCQHSHLNMDEIDSEWSASRGSPAPAAAPAPGPAPGPVAGSALLGHSKEGGTSRLSRMFKSSPLQRLDQLMAEGGAATASTGIAANSRGDDTDGYEASTLSPQASGLHLLSINLDKVAGGAPGGAPTAPQVLQGLAARPASPAVAFRSVSGLDALSLQQPRGSNGTTAGALPSPTGQPPGSARVASVSGLLQQGARAVARGARSAVRATRALRHGHGRGDEGTRGRGKEGEACSSPPPAPSLLQLAPDRTVTIGATQPQAASLHGMDSPLYGVSRFAATSMLMGGSVFTTAPHTVLALLQREFVAVAEPNVPMACAGGLSYGTATGYTTTQSEVADQEWQADSVAASASAGVGAGAVIALSPAYRPASTFAMAAAAVAGAIDGRVLDSSGCAQAGSFQVQSLLLTTRSSPQARHSTQGMMLLAHHEGEQEEEEVGPDGRRRRVSYSQQHSQQLQSKTSVSGVRPHGDVHAHARGPTSTASARGATPSGMPVLLMRGLRVRMGLHSGVYSSQGINYSKAMQRTHYSGKARITAAAVAGAAPGGMVVMSGATRRQLGPALAAVAEAACTNCPLLSDLKPLVWYAGKHIVDDKVPPQDLYTAVLPSQLARLLVLPQPGGPSPEAHPPLRPGLMGAPIGHVTIAVLSVSGGALLEAWNLGVWRAAVGVAWGIAEEQAHAFGGYMAGCKASAMLAHHDTGNSQEQSSGARSVGGGSSARGSAERRQASSAAQVEIQVDEGDGTGAVRGADDANDAGQCQEQSSRIGSSQGPVVESWEAAAQGLASLLPKHFGPGGSGGNDLVTAVFPSADMAVMWAASCMEAFLNAPWPSALLLHELGEEISAAPFMPPGAGYASGPSSFNAGPSSGSWHVPSQHAALPSAEGLPSPSPSSTQPEQRAWMNARALAAAGAPAPAPITEPPTAAAVLGLRVRAARPDEAMTPSYVQPAAPAAKYDFGGMQLSAARGGEAGAGGDGTASSVVSFGIMSGHDGQSEATNSTRAARGAQAGGAGRDASGSVASGEGGKVKSSSSGSSRGRRAGKWARSIFDKLQRLPDLRSDGTSPDEQPLTPRAVTGATSLDTSSRGAKPVSGVSAGSAPQSPPPQAPPQPASLLAMAMPKTTGDSQYTEMTLAPAVDAEAAAAAASAAHATQQAQQHQEQRRTVAAEGQHPFMELTLLPDTGVSGLSVATGTGTASSEARTSAALTLPQGSLPGQGRGSGNQPAASTHGSSTTSSGAVPGGRGSFSGGRGSTTPNSTSGGRGAVVQLLPAVSSESQRTLPSNSQYSWQQQPQQQPLQQPLHHVAEGQVLVHSASRGVRTAGATQASLLAASSTYTTTTTRNLTALSEAAACASGSSGANALLGGAITSSAANTGGMGMGMGMGSSDPSYLSRLICRGLRLKAGVDSGWAYVEVLPDDGHALYRGAAAEQARGLAAAAHVGQVAISQEVADDAQAVLLKVPSLLSRVHVVRGGGAAGAAADVGGGSEHLMSVPAAGGAAGPSSRDFFGLRL